MLRSAGNRGTGGKRIFGIPVASQAIAHPHRHVLINHIHRLHFAVAGLAKNPAIHVRSVIKVNVVRQRVNAPPLQRSPGSVHRCQLLDLLPIRFGHLVAVHAFLDGRDAGLARLRGAGMAVKARDPERAGMELMGIVNRLLRLIAANEPVGLRKPADSEHRAEDGHGTDRKNVF